MKLYTNNAVSQALDMLAENGYSLVTVEPGVLGHGHIICIAPDNEHYNVEITERFVNPWSCGHAVRNFDKISKRIESLLTAAGYWY